jgi:ABC-2 type transport system ATP-binding protein
MTKEAAHVIEVEHLTKRYGELLAVDGISFTVRKGEVFAFLGPNGAGKTTTVEIIETIRTPTSGSVRLLGMDVTKMKRGRPSTTTRGSFAAERSISTR